MATTNIKRITAQVLASYLSANIPDLAGKVHTVAPGPEEKATFPCATVLATGVMEFEAHNETDVWWDAVVDSGKVLEEVGEFLGTFEIRLYATSPAKREELEQDVIDLFMASPHRPGIIMQSTGNLTVMGAATLYSAPIAFSLDETEWREEFAWENRRFSFLDVRVEFPALVLQDAYTINSLRTAITQDLGSDVPDEVVEVQDDGSIIKST